ncbi:MULTISPECIES: hypothetical protein [unclassified Nostoc]|uniref:hypothetical protein n=1 Tax=unclassified Nostoc TaxID=2593658 RepID=UPI002AD42802|nr:hypothetical protein [Nostoc sp. DedQUE03]MDZ7974457.1 hypothetical protein [Nostoc sp. DedQUE03]MDZ8047140.1 hypothetical protein [Nostoc sp. DedQUE02]
MIALFLRFSVKRSHTLTQQTIALFLRFFARRSLTLPQQAIAFEVFYKAIAPYKLSKHKIKA